MGRAVSRVPAKCVGHEQVFDRVGFRRPPRGLMLCDTAAGRLDQVKHRPDEADQRDCTDQAFFGEMMLTATFGEVSGGTEVTLMSKNLPPGLRAAENEAGSRLSLEQLARCFE